MRYREMQAAAQTLLALLDAAAPVAASEGEAGLSARRRGADAALLSASAERSYDGSLPGGDMAGAMAQSLAAAAEMLPAVPGMPEAAAAMTQRIGTAEQPSPDAAGGQTAGMAVLTERWSDPEETLEVIDGFFRRDSRRYDGGFSLQ